MLILDSNTISYYFRGDPQVVPRLQALRPADLGVPAIVEYELRYGLLRMPQDAAAPRLAALAQLLRPLQLLPFDSECAAQAARIRVDLEAAGTPIGPHDTLIAATALRHQAALVTRNVREFSRVPGLQWLNWHDTPQ
jgi:tRNA(fMet)-specific endonuclease VapC